MYMHKYEWSGSQDTGDCSLWIRSAQIDFDDGSWECQVTASDFHTQDALSSFPVRLVVRVYVIPFVPVQPRKPKIEYNQNQVLPGHNLTALHGELAVIKCVSHFGNPPPILKWFLDQNEVTPIRKQENMTEIDIPKTWVAVSILELTISKENHGKTLRCVAVHETYATKSSSVEVRLDVMFIPETRLLGIPSNDIEESKDSVAIRCVVSANPKANVVWRRQGQNQAASLQELLQFSPVLRQHAGYYICQARNKAGESHPIMVQLDVKYPPKILSIGPDRLTTAPLFTSATFECVAEGNPQPTYQWLQRLPTPSDVILERGWESKLHIANVTYDYQGEYVCKVTNIIGGAERTIQSEAIALQVVAVDSTFVTKMPHKFENYEKLDMIRVFIICNEVANDAVALYFERFPERLQPEHRIFKRLMSSLEEYGSFERRRSRKYNKVFRDETEITVLAKVEAEPSVSSRQIEDELGVPGKTALNILRKNRYHPYKIRVIHDLLPGAPQVLRHITSPQIIVEKGETAKISLVVCADPRPRVVAWEWGSLRLEAGSELGRYHVDDVIQEAREDCYLATLRIKDTDVTDSRSYYLAVENDRGIDRHVVQLYVNEPLDVGTLVSLGAVGLAISLLMVCGCVYAIRTERWCFARKGDFKPADMNGEVLTDEDTYLSNQGNNTDDDVPDIQDDVADDQDDSEMIIC
ncbi:nephrin [Holotrichia oblita]|uniref:Nephrin n=1 Tax=Holotrichia oblita TaxID=644536 RepID=A0ACB9TVG0_HOLOL|nr:nephrin [Holotrichia oblita]